MARLDTMPTLGEFIKLRRKKLKMSQQELADFFNWNRSYIWNFENQNRKFPLMHIPRLASALRVGDLTIRKICAEREVRDVLEKYGLDKPGTDRRFRIEFKRVK